MQKLGQAGSSTLVDLTINPDKNCNSTSSAPSEPIRLKISSGPGNQTSVVAASQASEKPDAEYEKRIKLDINQANGKTTVRVVDGDNVAQSHVFNSSQLESNSTASDNLTSKTQFTQKNTVEAQKSEQNSTRLEQGKKDTASGTGSATGSTQQSQSQAAQTQSQTTA